uniref:hypothetical protein n=1 Tax=Nonlabens sp. Ci31 TaxID=2608253 RepID=UPI001F10BE7C|nr:hypothetical protein [Nonlabens sp. Ci31]
MKYFKALLHIFIVVLLTLITQVGGLIWIAVFSYFKYRKSIWNKRKRILSFSLVYMLCVFFITPVLAPLNNRRALPVFNDHIGPHNLSYVLLCRNYVHKDLYKYLHQASKSFYKRSSSNKLVYLDAGFPFIDGFPLLPHLSHDDGRKIDIAFKYKNKKGELVDRTPSLLGYGVYVEPNDHQLTQAQKCMDAGFWQYDYATYIGVNVHKELIIDEAFTKLLIEEMLLLSVEKIFIEPHLIPLLKLDKLPAYQRSKIRYHGCHAVRHDDHIHLQIPKRD